MKRFLPILALLFAGCMSYDAHLPEVSASEVHIQHHDSAGSFTIDAVGVAITDTAVTAKQYKKVLSYPFTQDQVEIKDYSRPRVLPAK